MNRLAKLVLSFAILLGGGGALAKSIFITGSIETISPKFEMTYPSSIYRGVNEYSVTGKTAAGSGCELTTNVEVAKTSAVGDLKCLFEWTSDTDSSWLSDGFTVYGRPLGAAGAHSRDYQISFLSGSTAEKVVLSTGQINYTLTEPAIPVITGMTTKTNSRTENGYSLLTHDAAESISQITVKVEPRPYDQVVKLNQFSKSCTVNTGASSCSVSLNEFTIAGSGANATGQVSAYISVSDKYNFIPSQTQEITFSWDIRPPVIEQFAYRAKAETNTDVVSIDVDGDTVTLNNNEMIVVVGSPHSADTADTWWLPDSVNLHLTPFKNYTSVNTFVTLEGEDISRLFDSEDTNDTNKTIESYNEPEKHGDSYVYRFAINGINDGQYVADISTEDVFSNDTSLSITDRILLDRIAPDVMVFDIDSRINSGDAVNFFEHLIITAQDSTSISNEILNIWLDDQPIGSVGEYAMAKRLVMTESLEANTAHTLRVLAKDENNNTTDASFQISYLPLSFVFTGVDNKKVALVQNQSISFKQTSGNKCSMYKTEQEAIQAAKKRNQETCSVEWTTLPAGLEQAWDTSSPELIGAFQNPGLNVIGANVWIHDKDGLKNLIKTAQVELLVSEPSDIEITFDTDGMYDDGKYAVEVGQSRIGRYRVKSSSSPIFITLKKDGKVIEESYIKQSDKYTEHNLSRTITDTNSANNRALWSENEYSVEVKYERLPTVVDSASAIAYAVPSSRVRLQMERSQKELSTKDAMTVTTTFGLYDSYYRRLSYVASEMGQWRIRIVSQDASKNVLPLTEWQAIEADGSNEFSVNFNADDIGDLRYYAEAEVVAPDPVYTQSVVSQRGTLKILKGTAINGAVKTQRVTGAVPLNVSMQYVYDTRDDKQAADDVKWFVSSDEGSTWEESTYVGPRFSFKASETGTWLVKGQVANRFTGEVSETDHIQVMAYQIPSLEVNGAKNTIQGMTRTYTLYDQGELADTGNLLIMWSKDDGQTFEEGGPTIEITSGSESSTKLVVKAAYLGFESDADSWALKKLTIRNQQERPVNIRIKGDADVETGNTLTLVADVREPYSNMDSTIVTEWVKPDGSVVSGDTINFSPTQADLDIADVHQFIARSWISDAKDQTYNEETFRVTVWKYQFPQFDIAHKQRVKVAPSTIEVWLRRPVGSNLYEDYKYDWNTFGKLELTRDYGQKARFTAKSAGLYPIEVTVTDDRGNSDTFMDYVEVLEPEPISIDLNLRYSNRWQRSPVNLNIRPTLYGGHPNDRVADYKWYLDGQLVPELEKSTANLENILTGEHEVTLKILTNYGQEAEVSYPVEVVPNTPPTCSLSYSLYSKTARIDAKCTDVDGKIAQYDWKIDDKERNNIGRRVSELRQPGDSAFVTVTATDDSGDTATASMMVYW